MNFVLRIINYSIHFQNSTWSLSKFIINILLHIIDVFSEKGLEFVSKILSHSSTTIENQGKSNDI